MKKGRILMLGTLLLSSFTMISCKGNDSSSNSVTSSSISENLNNPEYSIKVTSLSGKPLVGVKVEIFEGSNLVKEVEVLGCLDCMGSNMACAAPTLMKGLDDQSAEEGE